MCGLTGVDRLRRQYAYCWVVAPQVQCATSSRELHAVLRNRWVRHEAADVLLRGQGSACPGIYPR